MPKKIALELFQPFIIRRLKELNYADTIKSAKKMLERKDDQVWDILEEVTKTHPVLLNRAPTLHRMGIQAFEPVLIEGNAIRIHPLVCKGFNADFDGDQMAVHLPLSIEAQVEASVLMMSTNNIFSPANGNPIITPSQDIVMGCYWLTAERGVDELEKVEPGHGMVFHSPAEVFTAYDQKKLGVHAKIRVRLPAEKRVISEIKDALGKPRVVELPRKPSGLVYTTVGRVMFNDILRPDMAYYDLALTSKQLSRIIADCYQELGRRATIELLDKMKETGFQMSTRSGLSFATSDLKTPAVKEQTLKDSDKDVDKIRRQADKGVISLQERYNRIIDVWNTARDIITKAMLTDLQTDRRMDEQMGKVLPYLNPIWLMAHSGARGGTEQIRQLAGMRGLMAKPSGEIIETPIKANFREGLTVLEYFSSTHGARKGLADTALKTADSGYLTRKLADVAQNVVVTMEDCGTTQGTTKGVIIKGDEVDRPLYDAIRGRVSRTTIYDPISKKVVVKEDEMVTPDIARAVEAMGIDKFDVRSPMNCQASLGVCRNCYGMDLATGALVEAGMAVGIIAAQSIGEPGTQLTMRTFHIGGVATGKTVAESDRKAKKSGVIQLERIKVIKNEAGENIALTRNGEILIVPAKDQPALERFAVPHGAVLMVEDGQQVSIGTTLCTFDPFSTPIISEQTGKVRLQDIREGVSMKRERDPSGVERFVIIDHKGDIHPQVIVEDSRGNVKQVHNIPVRAYLEVKDGEHIVPGKIVAKTPREISGTNDITGGLPRVTEIFEARKPRDPAVMSQVSGSVRIGDRKRGKVMVYVQPVDANGKPMGNEVEHQIPPGRPMRVQADEFVVAGEPLVAGPLSPKDILQISGAEAVQDYLVGEVQKVYRAQRVDIDDKHIEVIVSQMLRKVKVTDPGDTLLLPENVMDKFVFQATNDRLVNECVKIENPGASVFEKGRIVPRDAYDEERTRLEVEGGKMPTMSVPRPARCVTELLGITKASVQSESFISAASFQETTKVLTEAALASKIDNLVGLKENVILGHLIPAGTGFRNYQDAEVRLTQVVDPAYEEEEAEEVAG